VRVRLLSVVDGRQLWMEEFDEKFTDIFSVQDSVSRKVSGALALTLTGAEKELLTKRHTNDIEAYQLYLMGRYHLNRWTDEGFWKALDYFRQALERDPDYALAHAGLADAYHFLGGFNALSPKESFPKAKQAALQALELDEHLAEARVVLAAAVLGNSNLTSLKPLSAKLLAPPSIAARFDHSVVSLFMAIASSGINLSRVARSFAK